VIGVIPAAGLGHRFEPLSRVIPKELLLLGDRPVLHHALDELAEAGLSGAVVVAAPWKRPLFERYLELVDLPLAVDIVEQTEPRGIGDAVLRAAKQAGDRFGVLLPDDVVTERSHWVALLAETDAAVCLREVPAGDVGRFGIAEIKDGRCVSLIEKPKPGESPSNLAIFGRYQVTAPVIESLERLARTTSDGELQLTDGFAPNQPRAVRFEGDVFDCGTPAEYRASWGRWRQ
jgi:UTP--glucose-1-phosphate uridylyltransferase